MDAQKFVYEVSFPGQTADNREFVEDLWARRKVGYLLDQIRAGGEKKELVDEVMVLARRYGIVTPYTSYLIVPDAVLPVAGAPLQKQKDGKPDVSLKLIETQPVPPALQSSSTGRSTQMQVLEFAMMNQTKAGDASKYRGGFLAKEFNNIPAGLPASGMYGTYYGRAILDAKDRWEAHNMANESLKKGMYKEVQEGKLGVDLSCDGNNLRSQTQLMRTATCRVDNRTALEVGGVWIDEAYDAKMPTVVVKAMSNAYFRILELQPTMKNVLRLGNHLVYVTPSGTALVVDSSAGSEEMQDAAIQRLFTKK
jgi:Ca-activated chloride channel family protein